MPFEKQWVRAELHCHTAASFDAYTSVEDLRLECQERGIKIVSIMEHDKISITQREIEAFRTHGIQIIVGCEMTTDRGAHICGLFMRSAVQKKNPRVIAEHILNEGGLIYVPHPLKPGSGLLCMHKDDQEGVEFVLKNASFLELYNGGWDSGDSRDRLIQVGQQYNLTFVAGSDSHKPWHIGRWVTEFELEQCEVDPSALSSAPVRIKAFRPSGHLFTKPRSGESHSWVRKIQGSIPYTVLISATPFRIKRFLKLAAYRHNQKRYVRYGRLTGHYEDIA